MRQTCTKQLKEQVGGLNSEKGHWAFVNACCFCKEINTQHPSEMPVWDVWACRWMNMRACKSIVGTAKWLQIFEIWAIVPYRATLPDRVPVNHYSVTDRPTFQLSRYHTQPDMSLRTQMNLKNDLKISEQQHVAVCNSSWQNQLHLNACKHPPLHFYHIAAMLAADTQAMMLMMKRENKNG